MSDAIHDLESAVAEQMSRAALEYLRLGLGIFHSFRRGDGSCDQCVIGILAVAAELIIKSHVATKSLATVYPDLHPRLRLLLSNPDSVPRFFNWKKHDIDLRSGAYRTMNFNESIECYFTLFPQMKQPLLPHLSFLGRRREESLHAVIPRVSVYDLERAAYCVLQIVLSLPDDRDRDHAWYNLSEDDRKMIADFEKRRVERVRIMMDQSRAKVADVDVHRSESLVAGDWNSHVTACPVCTSNALLSGYIELSADEDDEGPVHSLDFFATGLHCSECGLILNDSEEARLAGMPTLFDRTDEIDRWLQEHASGSECFLNDQ